MVWQELNGIVRSGQANIFSFKPSAKLSNRFLKTTTGQRNISEIVCDEDAEYEDVRIGACSGCGDGDMMVESEDNEEHLRIGQQQCQEALVSEELKRAAVTSQDFKH